MDSDPGGQKHLDPVDPDSDPEHWHFDFGNAVAENAFQKSSFLAVKYGWKDTGNKMKEKILIFLTGMLSWQVFPNRRCLNGQDYLIAF